MMETKLNSSKGYLITPSLLNSWLWIWQSQKEVTTNDSDTISYEDKQDDARIKALESFSNAIKKIQLPPNKYMIAGNQFEKDCYDGKTCFSEIIKDGEFQMKGRKLVTIDGIKFLLYGRLDVLKGDKIYDIKRVIKYKKPKYAWSVQHDFYMDLFPNAKEFYYLIWDGTNRHIERYEHDEERVKKEISCFIKWLENTEFINDYNQLWELKG